jgi:hypothetical protein
MGTTRRNKFKNNWIKSRGRMVMMERRKTAGRGGSEKKLERGAGILPPVPHKKKTPGLHKPCS